MLQALALTVSISSSRVIGRSGPSLFGACLEDVNHEVYGGLYDQRLFGESFEEPAPRGVPAGRQSFGGRWSPDGDGIHVGADSGAKLVFGRPLNDGLVEVDVRTSNDFSTNAGLLVRVTDPGVGADAFNGYEIALDTRQRRVILGKHVHDFHLLTSAPVDIWPGVSARLKVRLSGPQITVWVNGGKCLNFSDGDRPLLTGNVALRTWNSDVTFRRFRIDGQPRSVSLAGPGVSGAWKPVVSGSAPAKFDLLAGGVTGALCQHLRHGQGPGVVGVANAGLNGWGIAVRKGETMTGEVYARGGSPLVVALQDERGIHTYAQQVLRPGKSWERLRFSLTPTASDPRARFAVLLRTPGDVWLDYISLLDAPSRQFRGLPVRRDIADLLVRGGYGFLRYGGTMVNEPGYRWKHMIGPRDRRQPYVGHWYPESSNGFGIFDFLRFCERAGFRSAFALNMEETPRDAADLAGYLTAPTSTRWGAQRALDGHPAPYHPDYIELGNEEAIGNLTPAELEHYAARFTLLERAIHARAPGIKLVCGCWWDASQPAMRTVFKAIDGKAAAWDLHFWCDDASAGEGVGKGLDQAKALFHAWNPRSTLKSVIFEENGNHHGFERALGHASTLAAVLARTDFVLVDCAANALQPMGQNDNGWDQGQVFFSPGSAWGVPPYFAQKLAATNLLPIVVASDAPKEIPTLATRNAAGDQLAVLFVNPSAKPRRVQLKLGKFQARRGRLVRLREPGEVIETVPLDMKAPSVELAPRSISVVHLRR